MLSRVQREGKRCRMVQPRRVGVGLEGGREREGEEERKEVS